NAGIHFDLSQNRTAGFWNYYRSLSSGQTMSRTEIVEGILRRVPESWNLLRERGESNSSRHCKGLPAAVRKSDRRVQHARRYEIRHRRGVPHVFHSFFKSIISRSS